MRTLLVAIAIISALAWASPGWIRWADHDDEGYSRFVIELPLGTSYKTSSSTAVLRVDTGLENQRQETFKPDNKAVERIEVTPASGGTRINFYLQPGASLKKTFVLEGPAGRFRLVVDFLNPKDDGSKAQPSKPKPQIPVVVLDPGHGGPDPGTVGFVVEKQVTLDLARRVEALLQNAGIKVFLTRDGDYDLAPKNVSDLMQRKRIDLAKRARMTNGNRNLFVSIHVNSAERPARGVEVYYLGKTLDSRVLSLAIAENGGGDLGVQLTKETTSTAEQALADLIAQGNLQFSRHLAQVILKDVTGKTGALSRGVHSAPFYVLRYARIPAVLVEVGFANHPVEGKQLARSDYRQRLAEGIAAGILEVLGNGAFATAGKQR